MKKLKITSLQENEMNSIFGGAQIPLCACSCTCSGCACGISDTIPVQMSAQNKSAMPLVTTVTNKTAQSNASAPRPPIGVSVVSVSSAFVSVSS